MLPNGPYSEIDRTVVAIGFLSEVRAAKEPARADCTLTSRTREDLRRLAASRDDDAFAELTRRRDPEQIAA